MRRDGEDYTYKPENPISGWWAFLYIFAVLALLCLSAWFCYLVEKNEEEKEQPTLTWHFSYLVVDTQAVVAISDHVNLISGVKQTPQGQAHYFGVEYHTNF